MRNSEKQFLPRQLLQILQLQRVEILWGILSRWQLVLTDLVIQLALFPELIP
jgi:hypothetical protein